MPAGTTSVIATMKICNRIFKDDNIDIFDYLYIILASIIASCGFITNSETVIIGSMLISPLLKPVTFIAFDFIKKKFLHKIGYHLGHFAMFFALVFIFGLGMGYLGIYLGNRDKLKKFDTLNNRAGLIATKNRANQQLWLWISLIAICCGIALAFSFYHDSGKFSSLIAGAGISTSVLPPIIAGGMFIALANTELEKEERDELYEKSKYSLLLSGLNIGLVFITFMISKHFLCKGKILPF